MLLHGERWAMYRFAVLREQPKRGAHRLRFCGCTDYSCVIGVPVCSYPVFQLVVIG
jgi:hypothetical protein